VGAVWTPSGGPDLGAAGVAVARADAGRRPKGEERSTKLEDIPPFLPLRSVGPGAVLDGGFDVLRFRLGRMVGLAATLYAPLLLVQFLFELRFGLSTGADQGAGSTPFVVAALGATQNGWGLMFVVLNQLALSLLGMAAGFQVAAWLDGQDPTYGTTLRFMARRSWVALGLVVLTALFRVPFLCLSILGWWISDAFVFSVSAAAGGERLGPWAAMRVTVRRARHALGFAMVVSLGGLAISLVLRTALWLGPLALLTAAVPSGLLVTVVARLGSLVLLVTEPLVACIAARAWLELRCRTEGFDLERWRDAR